MAGSTQCSMKSLHCTQAYVFVFRDGHGTKLSDEHHDAVHLHHILAENAVQGSDRSGERPFRGGWVGLPCVVERVG